MMPVKEFIPNGGKQDPPQNQDSPKDSTSSSPPSEPKEKEVSTGNEQLDEFIRSFLKAQQPCNLEDLALRLIDKELVDAKGNQRSPRKYESIVMITLFLIEKLEEHGGIGQINGEIHVYISTHWQPLTKDQVQVLAGRFAEKIGNDVAQSHYFEDREKLYKQLLTEASNMKRDGKDVLMNFLNGTLELTAEGRHMREHRPKDTLTSCLGYDYDPEKTAPLFTGKFLKASLPDIDKQMNIFEHLGACFLPTLPQEAIFFMHGQGANGKSVFYRIISATLGETNVSALSFRDMNMDNKRMPMIGKLLNYSPEMIGKPNTEVLKAMAGKEPLMINPVYRDPFMCDPRSIPKFMVNCNTLPPVDEYSLGNFRRFYIVDWDKVIPKEERDPHLADNIEKSELAGVMNLILEGAERLLRKGDFSPCLAIESARERYQKEADNVFHYLNDKGYIPSTDHKDTMQRIAKSELYHEYRTFCTENGFSPCNSRNFRDRLLHQHKITEGKSGSSRFYRITEKEQEEEPEEEED